MSYLYLIITSKIILTYGNGSYSFHLVFFFFLLPTILFTQRLYYMKKELRTLLEHLDSLPSWLVSVAHIFSFLCYVFCFLCLVLRSVSCPHYILCLSIVHSRLLLRISLTFIREAFSLYHSSVIINEIDQEMS